MRRGEQAIARPRRTGWAHRIGLMGLFLASACTPHEYRIPDNSYVISGRNYTFAVYNSEHRLMTHPLEDLRIQVELRRATCQQPISDIYVVSHGWNFTASEAVANYHGYIELADQFLRSPKADAGHKDPKGCHDGPPDTRPESFQPYFIFITWVSTSNPMTDLTGAVLPFGLHEGVAPLTTFVDKYPLHLLTAWKQSLNAAHNALGKRFPDDYVLEGRVPANFGTDGRPLDLVDRYIGRDYPVSALLYELLVHKDVIPSKASKKAPAAACAYRPRDCQAKAMPLAGMNLHLVGHSYGAKLVAMAGMEALRRWILVKYFQIESVPADNDEVAWSALRTKQGLVGESVGGPDRAKNLLTGMLEEKLQAALRSYGEGSILPFSPVPDEWWQGPDEGKATDHVDTAVRQYVRQPDGSMVFPITSLILIDPAFHPGELWYPTGYWPTLKGTHLATAPASVLRLIPRKAIVYSKYDMVNGTLFNIREMVLNTQAAQASHSQLNDFSAYPNLIPIISSVASLSNGVQALVNGVVHGVLLYVGTTAVNLPADFVHHVKENDFNGLWIRPSRSGGVESVLKGTLNALDFFVPLVPPFFLRDEDQQGLFRMARPALGKTGLNKLADGRWEKINLYGLSGFYEGGQAPSYEAEVFCRFAATPRPTTEFEAAGGPEDEARRLRLYSFDASTVYNSIGIPGAHGDVRDREKVACNQEEGPYVEKRQYSFNFVYNFTKTNFTQGLEPLQAMSAQKRKAQ